MELDSILDLPLVAGLKGVPDSSKVISVREVGAQGWNVLGGGIPLPAALIKRDALQQNMRNLQHYLDQVGMSLAPHGKTTMCPQLFARQLEQGAWGITVATYAQARVALGYGVKRLLIANELVGKAEIHALSALYDEHPDVLVLSLVDSVEGAKRIESVLTEVGATRPFDVLIEVGIPGRRCGARTHEEALAIGHYCRDSANLSLRGVEGYEGVIVTGNAEVDAQAVREFLGRLTAVFFQLRDDEAFERQCPVFISAGGSAYFDLVAEAFKVVSFPDVVPIVRSGCYLSHDSGFYKSLLAHVASRAVLGPAPDLVPALEVWAQVVSRPESGLVILGVGRRDLSDDAGMPRIEQWCRPGADAEMSPVAVDGWSMFRMNDQHAYVSVPDTADIRIGDYVGIGISHPCTTFDRWPLLYEVDNAYGVVGALKTFF